MENAPAPESTEPKRGPGRPKLPEGEARDQSVSASVTRLERDALKAKAKALGKPLAAMARDALLALLLGALMAGCAGTTPAQATTIGRAVIHYTCLGARKLCEWTGNSDHDACEAIATACAVVDSGGSLPEE